MNTNKNPYAVQLGRLAAGKPKRYSAEEKAKRAARLQASYAAWRARQAKGEQQ